MALALIIVLIVAALVVIVSNSKLRANVEARLTALEAQIKAKL